MKIVDMTAVDLYCIIMLAMILIVASRLIYERYKAPNTTKGEKFVIWVGVGFIYFLPAAYAIVGLH